VRNGDRVFILHVDMLDVCSMQTFFIDNGGCTCLIFTYLYRMEYERNTAPRRSRLHLVEAVQSGIIKSRGSQPYGTTRRYHSLQCM
jgi:hypothetical protein